MSVGLGIAAVAAAPTLLQVGNGMSPETFQTISNVDNIKITSKTKVIDVTSHSTGIPWTQQFPTIRSAGDLSHDLFWVPEDPTQSSTTGGLRNLWENAFLKDWQLIYPDGNNSTDAYQGYVTQMSPSAKVGDVLRQAVMISMTGKPSLV
jgi:hypothetical protein